MPSAALKPLTNWKPNLGNHFVGKIIAYTPTGYGDYD